jgi:hypothetical protein
MHLPSSSQPSGALKPSFWGGRKVRIKNKSKRDTRNVLYTHQRHEGSYLNDDFKITWMTGWCDAWLPNTRLSYKRLSPSTNLRSVK